MNLTSSSARVLRSFSIAALILTAPALARADAPEADMAQARELLREGLDLRGKGDSAGALEKLKAAHSLAHTPITGLELGQTYLALGKLVEAREVFLSTAHMPSVSGETSRSAAARSQCATLAEQLRGRVASLRIRVAGVALDSVAVTLDGALIPAGALEAPRFVNPGTHVVVARSTAGGEAQSSLELAEGQSREVELKIVLTGGRGPETAPAGEPAPLAHPATTAAPLGTFSEPQSGRSHAIEWTLIGAGAAVGIAGGVLMSVAAGQSSDAQNRQDKAAFDSANTLWTGGLVGVIVGGASVLAGGIIFLIPDGPRSSSAASRLWLLGAADGVRMGGTW